LSFRFRDREIGRFKWEKNEKPAHRNRIIERHLNYQRGVESVWYKYKIQRGVIAMCEDYEFGAQRGVLEREKRFASGF
jgi:hypothetical protein